MLHTVFHESDTIHLYSFITSPHSSLCSHITVAQNARDHNFFSSSEINVSYIQCFMKVITYRYIFITSPHSSQYSHITVAQNARITICFSSSEINVKINVTVFHESDNIDISSFTHYSGAKCKGSHFFPPLK